MLDIREGDQGEIILSGRFDASQEAKAAAFFQGVTGSRVLDFKDLEYISSAGLGTLLSVQKRLGKVGDELKIINANKHIRDVFLYSGLSRIFEIDAAPSS